MLYLKQTFDVAADENGQPWLCVRYETTEYSDPFKVTHFWPIGPVEGSNRDIVKEMIGAEAMDCGQGHYQWRRSAFNYYDFSLRDRGQTKPIKTVREAFTCPKTRKGIPTRFYSGWWQKYTKAEGWVNIL